MPWSMDRLLEASEEKINAVPGIGPKTGHSPYSWLQDEENRALIEQLKQAGVNMQEDQKINPGNSCELSIRL
jgi:DNA ligase (NAD+)